MSKESSGHVPGSRHQATSWPYVTSKGSAASAVPAACQKRGGNHRQPACDLVMEWTFFTDDSAAAFRRGLHLDEATWSRGRGWALWKALPGRESLAACAAARR